MAEERVKGSVRWFNNELGYGFIMKDGDAKTEYFVHFSYILKDGYKSLKPQQKVTFVIVNNEGKLQAQQVMPE